VWKIKQFGGGKEFLMRAELGLPSVKGDDELGGGMTGGFGGSMGGVRGEGKAKRPISVKFEIPYFTTSGIQVRYLKIIEPKVCDVEPFITHRKCKNLRFATFADIYRSFNTLPCHGCDISHNLATSRYACPTCSEKVLAIRPACSEPRRTTEPSRCVKEPELVRQLCKYISRNSAVGA
jgi:hypothetical protein